MSHFLIRIKGALPLLYAVDQNSAEIVVVIQSISDVNAGFRFLIVIFKSTLQTLLPKIPRRFPLSRFYVKYLPYLIA